MRVKPLRSRGGRIARSPQANWGLEIWIGRESLFSGRGTRGSGRRRPCARGGTGAVRPPGEARTHRRATPCGLAQQESPPFPLRGERSERAGRMSTAIPALSLRTTRISPVFILRKKRVCSKFSRKAMLACLARHLFCSPKLDIGNSDAFALHNGRPRRRA